MVSMAATTNNASAALIYGSRRPSLAGQSDAGVKGAGKQTKSDLRQRPMKTLYGGGASFLHLVGERRENTGVTSQIMAQLAGLECGNKTLTHCIPEDNISSIRYAISVKILSRPHWPRGQRV